MTHDPIQAYIASFLALDHPILAQLSEREKTHPDALPSIGPEAGRLLGLLARLMGAQRLLEFGTSLGYSTIWLAQAALATGGRLTSIEKDSRRVEDTRRSLAAAGLVDQVELIQGDAAEVIETLEGPYDLILQDSSKALYPLMLERCIALVRPGGLLVADDTLFLPQGVREEVSAPIHRYNELVFADPRLYSTILPIGDGVTLSLKVNP